MNALIEAALDYAARGWHVFPLVPNSKRPAIPSHSAGECDGSDPYCAEGHLGWEERSTVDSDEIHAMWASSRHGIAIATGPSSLLVLDIDVSKSSGETTGMHSLAELEARCGHRVPERTFTVATPSGGQHRYFGLHPDMSDLPTTTTGRLGVGLDTRGRGGYVVAPPTSLSAGASYRVACSTAPATAPRWLIDELLASQRSSGHQGTGRARSGCVVRHADRYVQAAIDGEIERVVSAQIGGRNHALFLASIALGQLVGADLLAESEALDVLHEAARSQAEVPGDGYDERQATATIRSGFDRGVQEPRQVRNRA